MCVFNLALQDTQEQLCFHGLHRVLGAWLCCLPSSSPGPVRVALLRALRKAPFVEATLYWVVRYGIFAHVCQLMDAPQLAVKEQATALKVPTHADSDPEKLHDCLHIYSAIDSSD